MSTTLEKLLAKQEQLANRIKKEETKARMRQRKLETRRKILLGSLVEAMMEKDTALREDIERRLESFLNRPVDREAFGLTQAEPSPDPQENSEADEHESAA